MWMRTKLSRTLAVLVHLSYYCLYAVEGLRITTLEVPSLLRLGEPTQLNCSFTLERNEHVYTIKWYKGKKEIYAYSPDSNPPVKVFKEEGVNIDADAAHSGKPLQTHSSDLILRTTDANTEGRYRCEVSLERPFTTEKAEKVLIVYDVPPDGPTISNLKSGYGSRDLVRATCSYGPSRPDATLEWHINHMAVVSGEKGRRLEENTEMFPDGRSKVQADLSFNTTQTDFIGTNNSLKLSCTSRVNIAYNISSEEIVVRRRFNRPNLSFEVHRAGPWKTSSSIGPKVESKPNKGNLNENNKLTLTCWSEGGAVQSLKWYRNDKEVESKYISDLSNAEKPHAQTTMNIRMTEEIIQTKTETRFKCVATYLSQQEHIKTVELPLVNSLYSRGFHVFSSSSHPCASEAAVIAFGLIFACLQLKWNALLN